MPPRSLAHAFSWLVLFIVGLAVVPAQAQDSGEPVPFAEVGPTQIIDVPFGDQWLVQMPDTWLVWKRDDYTTASLAASGARRLYEPVGPSYAGSFTDFSGLSLTAIRPELLDEAMLEVLVQFVTREEVAEFVEKPVESVTLEDFSGYIVDLSDVQSIELYGRPALIRLNQDATLSQIIVLTDFADQGVFALTDMIMPTRFYETVPVLAAMIATSLRTNDIEFNPAFGTIAFEALSGDMTVQVVECLLTAAGSVNLRTGPGTDFALHSAATGGLRANGVGQTIGRDGMIWWKLPNDAWVRSDVVAESGNCEALPTLEN